MCCLFCLSFRGVAYFGTTAQILLGLGIVIKYSASLSQIQGRDGFLTGTVGVVFTYGLLLFTFGCCIFRGVESERLRVLKVAVGGFTLMQFLVLVSHLTLLAFTFEELKEDERLVQVTVLALNLVITFIHLTTLFLYMIGLAKRDLRALRSNSASTIGLSSPGSKSEGHGGRYSVGSSLTLSSMGQRYVDGRWEDLHA